MAARRRAGSAPCISAMNSSMRAGPSEQLTPATSTPSAARKCATSAGPAPEVVTPSFPSVTSATTGRSVVSRAILHCHSQLVQVGEGFQYQQIGAGFPEHAHLLGEGRRGLFLAQPAP